MTTSPVRGGSSVSARNRTPSLNLAKLAELVSKSIPPLGSDALQAIPLLSVEGKKLRVNTRSVIQRLITHESFKPSFEPGDDSGFVRDMVMPPFGTAAKVGGRLVSESEAATAKQLESLHTAVSLEFDQVLGQLDPNIFTVASLEKTLQLMTQSIGERIPELPRVAKMVPVHFAPPGRKAAEREHDIGRVLSAMETIDGRDWLEVLLAGISRKLHNDGLDQDEVDGILSNIRKQRNQPRSQIAELLDFLEDEALSRVRMQISMRLMDAVAAQSNRPGLKAYVKRVHDCFERFAGAEGESLLLDVSNAYGVQNNVDLADELRKALFYNCLPVWAEWSVQLFERRTNPNREIATVREVSYRFRINGDNPQSGKSAFDTRLDRIHDRMLAQPGPDARIQRSLAELIFLDLVIPDSLEDDGVLDVFAKAKAISDDLKTSAFPALDVLWRKVAARSKVMDQLGEELINVLRSKSTSLVDAAKRRVDKFMVYVHKDLVNWEALQTMASPSTDIFVKSDKGADKIAWFRHLQVSERANLPGSIASLSVETELQERTLSPLGEPYDICMARELSDRTIPARFVPFHWDKKELTWRPDVADAGLFDAGVGVDIEYSMDVLRLRHVKDDVRPKAEQLRTAVLVGFMLVTYIVLWELVRRLKQPAQGELVQSNPAAALSMSILRLQHDGKQAAREDDTQEGNTAVYCVSQAIEKALSRELPVKLQGLSAAPGKSVEMLRWTKRGALHALLGGQPLKFGLDGSLDKVALVTYVTRPCDVHPQFGDAEGHLFISRTYVANRSDNEANLRMDRMQSRLVESSKAFKTPQLILEEVSRLEKAGFVHILLLSHHFGNRHLGRASERHAPHGTREFLDDAANRFPNVHLYPLRRDVFPATRLRKRTALESAFEVLSFEDHQKMYREHSADVLRSLMPIYTFATLNVVGDENRPQSGFCTYFFDLETRVENLQQNELIRQNILGTGAGKPVRDSLISVLRAIHFMESEKPAVKQHLLPVLDPFDWASPSTTAAAGEVEIMSRRRNGNVLLSLPAVLAHVTKVLHKEAS
ncbi:hypothetical protein [Massilia sp. TWR1-2-2]|uniref:hypothetical protein n=1 Tax=Massilia sp. TWR1-2-2 TaxID=2804584 RepID=UPI003CF818C6